VILFFAGDLLAVYLVTLRLRDSFALAFGGLPQRAYRYQFLYTPVLQASLLIFRPQPKICELPRAPLPRPPPPPRKRSNLPDLLQKLINQEIETEPTAHSAFVLKNKKNSQLLPAMVRASVDVSALWYPVRHQIFKVMKACAGRLPKHGLCVSIGAADGVLDAIMHHVEFYEPIPVTSITRTRRERVRFHFHSLALTPFFDSTSRFCCRRFIWLTSTRSSS
jgi:hypothetical protein